MTRRPTAAQAAAPRVAADWRPGDRRRRQADQPDGSPERRDAEAGNAALELVILAPVLILLICMVIAAGRTAIAQGSVDAAARDAARQASISRSPEAATAAAMASASGELARDGLTCTPIINLPGLDAAFGIPLGAPASVTAVVRCTVSLSDLLVPGLPGSVHLKYRFTSPLDPYRGRTP